MGRRWPYRVYFLMMCLFYMLMVFVFHGQLQLEILQNKQMRGIVRHVHAALLKFNESSDNVNGFREDGDLSRIHSQSDHQRLNRLSKNADDCPLSPSTSDYQFQTVVPSMLYVYSAYWDARTSPPYIRVMAILARKKKDKIKVSCCMGGLNVNASVYEMCENHNKMFGGFIFSFPVDKDRKPCHVTLEVKEEGSLVITMANVSLIEIAPLAAKYEFGVCIPPLFGDIEKGKLVEFIELNQLLGAQHFIFYNFHISKKESREILEYYQSRGILTVIPWNLPTQVKDTSIWYHGQLIAHNDCMYRAMSLYRVMVLQDIDEYIVPHTQHKTWSTALSGFFREGVVGLSFHSAFFDPKVSDPRELLTMTQLTRTRMFSRVRTKVMILPAKIFEVGIHHVSKPLKENMTIKMVDTKVAYLHHYRKCVKNFGMKCDQFEEDRTMLKYMDALRYKFNSIMNLTLT